MLLPKFADRRASPRQAPPEANPRRRRENRVRLSVAPFASTAFCLNRLMPQSFFAPRQFFCSLPSFFLSLPDFPLVLASGSGPYARLRTPVFLQSSMFLDARETHEGGVIPVSDEKPARPLIPVFLSPHLVSLFLSPPSCSFGVVVGRRRQPATHTPLSVTRGCVEPLLSGFFFSCSGFFSCPGFSLSSLLVRHGF